MALIRKEELFPGWSKFLSDMFDQDLTNWNNRNFSTTNTTLPAVNISEDEDGYEVEMAAPGMTKKDFKLELENNVLTISSEKEMEKEDEKQDYCRREFSYQSFSRSFTLPNTVKEDKITASYENGILRISIPKKEEAKPKPAKKIDIK